MNDSTFISFNLVHSKKAEDPMDITDDGIETLVSDEHPSKALDPMDVTDDGIETLVSDEHPSNDPLLPELSIFLTLFPRRRLLISLLL